jgi:hypothetical protein
MPPDSTTVPPPDPILAILQEIAQSSALKTLALGMLARELEGSVRSFSKAHGHRGAAEERILNMLERFEKDSNVLRYEVRQMMKRMGPLELEVADLRDEARTRADPPKPRDGGDNGQ